MLNPDDRRLYTDALRPPPGFRFTDAIAGTYSLDLETLLTVPLHLALFSADEPLEELLKDGVALLEAIRRTSAHVTVYGQTSRVLAPAHPHVLYGLLEPVVVEVSPPASSGAFHPKLWLIRFDNADTGATRLRLLVLTRNVTGDRCWDLVLTLEGEPGARAHEGNRQLQSLVARLPALAIRVVSEKRIEQARILADLALHTEWQTPHGYDRLRFHALGLDGTGSWLPDDNGELAVVSPFVADAALRDLLASTKRPVALVSRPEELALIEPTLLERFERVMVMAEQAELADGEETPRPHAPGLPGHGLHAKAYIAKRGWDTHIYVGSANATNPALVNGTNVELVAELIGKRSRVGAVEDILDGESFGALLTDYLREADPEPVDPEVKRALEALENARRNVASAGMRIRFTEGEAGWQAELFPGRPVGLTGVRSIRAWLVTRERETAADVASIAAGATVRLEPSLLQYVTSFVAFELTAGASNERVEFVLGLHAEGMPVAERDAAIVRDVIRNREGFLRYVLLLLAEADEGADVFLSGADDWMKFSGRRPDGELPIFEHLTRAFCRQPERLESIRRLMDEVGAGGEGEIVPEEFRELWQVFEAAVRAAEESRP